MAIMLRLLCGYAGLRVFFVLLIQHKNNIFFYY